MRLDELDAEFEFVPVNLLAGEQHRPEFLRINPAWTRALGWAEEELTGRPFLDFVHPEDSARTVAEAGRIAQSGGSVDFENRYCRRDGGWLS